MSVGFDNKPTPLPNHYSTALRRLTQPVRAVHGLGLRGYIPPGVQKVDAGRRGEVQRLAPRLQ